MYSNLFVHYPSWRIMNVPMTNNLIIHDTCASVYYPVVPWKELREAYPYDDRHLREKLASLETAKGRRTLAPDQGEIIDSIIDGHDPCEVKTGNTIFGKV